jgi:hemolysin III
MWFRSNIQITRPAMRGTLHQAAFFASLGAGLMLIASTHTHVSRVATIIYVIGLVGLFGFSALYHRPIWGSTARRWLRRIDHSWIFVMIAGSATPVLIVGLGLDQGGTLLLAMWIAAAIGTAKCMLWTQAPRLLNVIMYVGVGWISIPYLPRIEAALGFGETTLLLVGGLIYSIGAVIYFFKKPNPFPKIFGYHEIFHALVVIASGIHFKVIYDIVSAV